MYQAIKSSIVLLLLLSFVLLNGCSTVRKKDGPPPFDVDVSKIPDAVPRVEPLSKIGNMPSYVVFGKRYYVLRSSRNFHERGVASWYGTKFHKQRTSSGERYNMLAMTAAHRTLPLPTYLQVTNVKNGKRVIVKVNDRGPFASNRIIDLSYVAAKKLGMIGHGTTMVDIKSIDPRDNSFFDANWLENEVPAAPTMAPSPSYFVTHPVRHASNKKTTLNYAKRSPSYTAQKRAYFLQVGAFQNRQLAEKLKHRLAAITRAPIKIHNSSSWYRVQVGPVHDSATAERLSRQLRLQGIHSTKAGLELVKRSI